MWQSVQCQMLLKKGKKEALTVLIVSACKMIILSLQIKRIIVTKQLIEFPQTSYKNHMSFRFLVHREESG